MSSYKQKISKFLELLEKSKLLPADKKIVISLLEESKIDIAQNQTSDITKMSVAQLKEICKSKNLPVSGKKQDLIRRINDMPDTNKTIELFNKKEKAATSIIKQKLIKTNVIELEEKHGHSVHGGTGLVFDKNARAIGKHIGAGEIAKLNAGDIDVCKDMKFDYELPDNLDNIFEDIEDENLTKYEFRFDQEEAQFIDGIDDDEEPNPSDDDDF